MCDSRANLDCDEKRNGTVPVIHDADHALVHDCRRERGGTKTIGIPQFVPVVENLPDPNAD